MIALDPVSSATASTFAALVCALYAEDPGPVSMTPERALAQVRGMVSGDVPAWPFLVRVDGQVAGHVILVPFWSNEFGGLMVFLDELFVAPAFRGRGVGSEVIGRVLALGRERGWVRVELEVNRTNVGARRLYARLGFEDEVRDLLGVQIRPVG